MRQYAWTDDHEEVDRQTLPGDVAQAGHSKVNVPAEDVHPDSVADSHVPAFRHIRVERDQRRTVVVHWPPLAGDNARSFGSDPPLTESSVLISTRLRVRVESIATATRPWAAPEYI